MKPSRFVRESLGFALSLYLARVVMLGRGLAAAAALGPAGFGGWNALNLIFDYGSYASAGAFQGLDLIVPGAIGRGDTAAARAALAAGWRITLTGALLFGSALGLYLLLGGHAFDAFPGAGAPLLMLVAAWLQLAFQYHASGLRALGRVPVVSQAQAAQAMLGGGIGLVTVWTYGVWGLLVGWIAGSIAALALMRRAGPEIPLVPGGWRLGLAVARAGIPIHAYFAITLLLRSVDRLALVHAGADTSLGLYGVGLMISATLLYLPESAAFVLFPRLAAAAAGARDADLTLRETLRVQRAITSLLPIAIALAAVWIEPVVRWLLPAYAQGVGALRLLALGTVFFAAATVPGYALLASVRRARLIAVSAGSALISAALVFAAAARDPRAEPVAAAAVAGYAIFSILVLALASLEWERTVVARFRLVAESLLPGVALGVGTWILCSYGRGGAVSLAFWRSVPILLSGAVLLWTMVARGPHGPLAERTPRGD